MTSVLVAGGATGIGRATVRALRSAGADVYLADVNDAAAAELAAELAAVCSDGRLVTGHHDMAQADAPADAVSRAVAEFGRLDGVVITAALHRVAPLEELSLEDWESTMALNVRAPFLLVRAAVASLTEAAGSVVFTGSTAAFRGSPGTFAYAASKGALISLTRSLAVELGGRGIRVNCVCPGWIDTPFNDPFWSAQDDRSAALADLATRIPAGRQGRPEEAAAMIVHLLGAEAAYVSGQSFVVDGGLLSA